MTFLGDNFLYLVCLQPVLSPPTIGFQGYVHAICLLHLLDYDFLYKLLFSLWNAEIQFVIICKIIFAFRL